MFQLPAAAMFSYLVFVILPSIHPAVGLRAVMDSGVTRELDRSDFILAP